MLGKEAIAENTTEGENRPYTGRGKYTQKKQTNKKT